MRNLLDIELNFVNSLDFSEITNNHYLDLSKVIRLHKSLHTADKNKLKKTMELAEQMHFGKKWFESTDVQNTLNEEGILWTIEHFADKIFHCSKSWFYKCLKAYDNKERLNEFLTFTNSNPNESVSIENFNRFTAPPIDYQIVERSSRDSVAEDTLPPTTESEIVGSTPTFTPEEVSNFNTPESPIVLEFKRIDTLTGEIIKGCLLANGEFQGTNNPDKIRAISQIIRECSEMLASRQ